MTSSRISCLGLTLALTLRLESAASGATAVPPDPYLSLDVKQGELWAAECLAMARPSADCNRRALQVGKPVGIFEKSRFTVLLLDSRVLGGLCAHPLPQRAPLRVQAQGIVHEQDLAMTVFQLKVDCGSGYRFVDLPYSAVSVPGAEGGDE